MLGIFNEGEKKRNEILKTYSNVSDFFVWFIFSRLLCYCYCPFFFPLSLSSCVDFWLLYAFIPLFILLPFIYFHVILISKLCAVTRLWTKIYTNWAHPFRRIAIWKIIKCHRSNRFIVFVSRCFVTQMLPAISSMFVFRLKQFLFTHAKNIYITIYLFANEFTYLCKKKK